jgi:hypothetical protein
VTAGGIPPSGDAGRIGSQLVGPRDHPPDRCADIEDLGRPDRLTRQAVVDGDDDETGTSETLEEVGFSQKLRQERARTHPERSAMDPDHHGSHCGACPLGREDVEFEGPISERARIHDARPAHQPIEAVGLGQLGVAEPTPVEVAPSPVESLRRTPLHAASLSIPPRIVNIVVDEIPAYKPAARLRAGDAARTAGYRGVRLSAPVAA